MPARFLHLFDPTTTSDGMAALAQLVARPAGGGGTASGETGRGGVHRVVGMGHREMAMVAAEAGMNVGEIRWVSSLGWADPAGWRAVRREVAAFLPTHIHAWGTRGVVAAAVSSFAGARLATFATVPSEGMLRLLRVVDRRPGNASGAWRWVGTSESIARRLRAGGLGGDRVFCVRPGVRMGGPAGNHSVVKEALGISSTEGPIILLGGEGAHARHDYGLWAAAILRQIFPRTRVIVRDDPRGRLDVGLDRLQRALPEESMLAVAPAELSWGELLRVADMLLVTPDGPVQTGTILQAMAAGVPVIGTPVECVTEVIAHGITGLLAKMVKPRMIAARLQEFMDDATVRWPLIDRARAAVYEQYRPSAMLEAYAALYTEGRTASSGAVAAGGGR